MAGPNKYRLEKLFIEHKMGGRKKERRGEGGKRRGEGRRREKQATDHPYGEMVRGGEAS